MVCNSGDTVEFSAEAGSGFTGESKSSKVDVFVGLPPKEDKFVASKLRLDVELDAQVGS